MEEFKVLYIMPLSPPVHGASLMGDRIKEYMSEKGEYSSDFINLNASDSLENIGKRSIGKYIRILKIYFRVLGKLLTRRYDLCYLAITVRGAGFLKDAPIAMMCRLLCKNIVIHQHNKGVADYSDRRLYDFLYRRVYKNTKVILLSQHLYPEMERYVPGENIYICHNGIPVCGETMYREAASGASRLLFLSNLIESKGCIVLLDTCKILQEEGVEFACDFVGAETFDISAEEFRHEISIRGLENKVLYHGPRYGAEKDDFFDRADIFVLPSFNEAFGLVILEAMQRGLPVVSTFEGGIPDLVEDGVTGMLCHKKDPEDLARKLRILIEDSDLRLSMGRKGYERFNEKFTEEVFKTNFMNIINDLVNRQQSE